MYSIVTSFRKMRDRKLRKFCVKHAAKNTGGNLLTDTAHQVYLFIHDGWNPYEMSEQWSKTLKEQKT